MIENAFNKYSSFIKQYTSHNLTKPGVNKPHSNNKTYYALSLDDIDIKQSNGDPLPNFTFDPTIYTYNNISVYRQIEYVTIDTRTSTSNNVELITSSNDNKQELNIGMNSIIVQIKNNEITSQYIINVNRQDSVIINWDNFTPDAVESLRNAFAEHVFNSFDVGLSSGGTHFKAVVRYKLLSFKPSFLFTESA